MELTLKKIFFDTKDGKKSLASCSDEEFEQFLKENDIDIINSSGEWSEDQRQMIVDMMASTMQELFEISKQEENDDVGEPPPNQ